MGRLPESIDYIRIGSEKWVRTYDVLDDIFKAWEEGDVDKFMSYCTNSGWICPKCDKVYSPHVKECSHCNKTDNDVLTNCNRGYQECHKCPDTECNDNMLK